CAPGPGRHKRLRSHPPPGQVIHGPRPSVDCRHSPPAAVQVRWRESDAELPGTWSESAYWTRQHARRELERASSGHWHGALDRSRERGLVVLDAFGLAAYHDHARWEYARGAREEEDARRLRQMEIGELLPPVIRRE